ncbi:MAG: hypothetical protein NXI32_09315 [bacterium]|nr:hypothetical protein [bacterium]
MKPTEAFNVLNQKAGGRLTLDRVDHLDRFHITYANWGKSFLISYSGVLEKTGTKDDEGRDVVRNTPASEWLTAVAEGKVRIDDGTMVDRASPLAHG